jgi:rare lipoprotein A
LPAAGHCEAFFMSLARIASACAVILTAGMLGGCAMGGGFPHDTSENFSTATYGPAAVRTVAYGDAIPKGGGHYMVGEPYRIAGKTYIPREDPHYSQVGVASWYGHDFHGRETANGEIYDLDGVTAAHPTMPLPSYARVTNLENGRSITVRVNDRGPFAENRIIDVSRTVARMLDFEDQGTVKVKVDYVGPAPLDGNDGKMLLASYREPGSTPAVIVSSPVQVAIASTVTLPAPLPRSVPAASSPALVQTAAVVTGPAPAVSKDPIAPLIARSGTVSAYSVDAPLSPAQEAADVLARPDLKAQLAIAAAKKATELGLRPSVNP